MTDRDSGRSGKARKGRTDPARHLLVELFGDQAPDVVCLEYVEVHRAASVEPRSVPRLWIPPLPTMNGMPDTAHPTVSVVIPIHNEAKYLDGALERLHQELAVVEASVDVFLVENGSTDETLALAHEAASRHAGLTVLELPEADYGGAMRAGFLDSEGEWAVNFDIDYFSGDFLNRALELAAEADLVLASKRTAGSDDKRGLLRRTATFVFNLILRVLLRSGVSDTHGMKAVRRKVIDDIAPQVASRQDLFDTELVIRAERAGYRIVEVPVTVEETRAARSSLLRRVPRTLRGVWRIRRELRR